MAYMGIGMLLLRLMQTCMKCNIAGRQCGHVYIMGMIGVVIFVSTHVLRQFAAGQAALQLLQLSSDGNEVAVEPFDCWQAPQAKPVLAHEVEGVERPFMVSLADLWTPQKPNRNFERVAKGKKLQKATVATMTQRVLRRRMRLLNASKAAVEWVVDVGANVGMATFAAAAMGFGVVAVEPVLENMQRLCDGVYFNRENPQMVKLFHAALSDKPHSNFTIHKVVIIVLGCAIFMIFAQPLCFENEGSSFEANDGLRSVSSGSFPENNGCLGGDLGNLSSLSIMDQFVVFLNDWFCEQVLGRLDNSAVSAEAAVAAFSSNEVVAVTVPCTTVDSLVHEAAVAMLKVDVQGYEYRVLRGATRLLGRPAAHAPYLVYEVDEKLLRANNSSSREILALLQGLGYKYCRKEGVDRHCWKDNLVW